MCTCNCRIVVEGKTQDFSDLCKLELYIVQLGEKKYAVFAIKGPTLNFEIPSHFEQDGVTERVYCVQYKGNIIFIRKFQLHVYRCKTKRELRAVIRRHFPRVCSYYSFLYLQ